MTTATIDIPAADLLAALQLTRKYKGANFPITLAKIPAGELTAMASAYATILVQRNKNPFPLGKQLVTLADAHIGPVVDAINTPVAPVTTFNTVTAFKKGDNTLLAGLGNPNGKLAVVSNTKLELALGARKFNNLTLPVPTDGSYAIELEEGEDWTVVLSAGLLDSTTSNITELYDVVFTMFGDSTGLETGAKAEFKLVWTGENYNWVSTTLGVISNAATNTAKSVSQDIQRLSFYGSVVHPAIPTGDVPTGTFKVRLKATHRKTAAVMTNDITVVVTTAVAE
ncbi:hypothetical protein D3C87_1123330 [compost metagenome]